MKQISDRKVLGHLSSLVAYVIFGLNIIICKELANSGIVSPQCLFCFRATGAAVLFWGISLFFPVERVTWRDMLKIFAASMIGLYLTQMFFLEGIRHITPMDCTLLSTLTPIFTMAIAAVALKEPITWKKAGGVAISFLGVMLLILNSTQSSSTVQQTTMAGVILILLNGLGWASYLGIFRKLITRYSVVTYMKWMFLFSMCASVPFGFSEMVSLDYAAMPVSYRWQLAFLIVMSTCVAYFLVPIGQKILRPTVVSLYGYVQPLLASVISICMGMDIVTWQKLIAAAAMISGAVMVNFSRSRADMDRERESVL